MPAPEGADQEAYENYCSAIEEWHELYEELEAYAAEALNAEEHDYTEDALAKAFSYAADLLELEERWQDVLEKFPVEGDSLEYLLENTERSPGMSPGLGMSIKEPRRGEEISPKQRAALEAVRENYHQLEQKCRIQQKNREGLLKPLEVNLGNKQLKIDV